MSLIKIYILKMNKNLMLVLIFFLVLVGLFWLMPNKKIDIIGDFFKKIITPLAVPTSLVIGISLGIVNYKKIIKNQKNKLL